MQALDWLLAPQSHNHLTLMPLAFQPNHLPALHQATHYLVQPAACHHIPMVPHPGHSLGHSHPTLTNMASICRLGR